MIIITSPNASDIVELFRSAPATFDRHVTDYRQAKYIADRDAENAIRLQDVADEYALIIAEVRQRRAPVLSQAAE